jgi:hypothetical protein
MREDKDIMMMFLSKSELRRRGEDVDESDKEREKRKKQERGRLYLCCRDERSNQSIDRKKRQEQVKGSELSRIRPEVIAADDDAIQSKDRPGLIWKQERSRTASCGERVWWKLVVKPGLSGAICR